MVEKWIDKTVAGLMALDLPGMRDSGILPGKGDKFFPVIGYPPLTMFSDMDDNQFFMDLDTRPVYPGIAYFHIPFCPSRCTFCHWITKTKSKQDEVDVYLDYLEREMVLYKEKLGVDKIEARSILVGGGTPTYLTSRQMERFLQSIHRHYDLSVCTQFSVEAEPKTLLGEDGRCKLEIMRDYRVDRISMGVQSFDDEILRYMGRVHNRQDVFDSIDVMHQVGIDNIMIDLIYGYPGQSLESWIENMLTAVSLDIEGFQLYRLRIKKHGDRPGNIIQQFDKAPDRFPEHEKIMLMKYAGIMIAEEHGFHEWQARIFSRSEARISHYLRDWCCGLTDVAGVGVSAWSNMRGVFALNVGDDSLQSYYDLIDQNKVAINRGKVRSADDELRRSFILPLKNMQVSKAAYQQRTGVDLRSQFGPQIDWLKGFGLIEENESTVRLTSKGRFFADEVSTQFFNPDYLPFPEVLDAIRRAMGE